MIKQYKSDNNVATHDYIAILLLILSSGTAYFYLYHAGITLLMLLGFSFLYSFLRERKYHLNLFLIVYSVLIPVNYLLYSYDMNLIGDVIMLVSTYIIVSSLNYNRFRRELLDLTVILCVISIILEALFVMGRITPVLYGDTGYSGLFGHYIFAFHAFGGGMWGMNTQLYGIFWEPGIYQMLLNICLLFNLDLFDKDITIPYKRIKLAILILALVLTRSTTGYLTFGTIIIGYLFNKSSYSNSKTSKVLVALSLMTFYAVVTYSSVVADKFSEDNASYLARSNDWVALWNVIKEHPILGSGVHSKLYIQLASKYGMTGSQSAGILLQTAQFGVLWLIAFYYSLSKELKKRHLLIPPLFYVVAVTFLGIGEPLVYSPLFLLLVLPFKDYKYE